MNQPVISARFRDLDTNQKTNFDFAIDMTLTILFRRRPAHETLLLRSSIHKVRRINKISAQFYHKLQNGIETLDHESMMDILYCSFICLCSLLFG